MTTPRSELRFFPETAFRACFINSHPCKERKDGAPSVLVVLAKSGAMIHTHELL